MEEKSHLSIFAIIKNVAQSFFKLVIDLKNLAAAEAKLAMQSLVNLIILAVVGLLLAITTWICILAMVVASLVSIHVSWLSSFFVVALLNVLALCIVGLYIVRMKNNLTFQATRRQLRSLSNSEETAREKSIAKN